MTSMLAQRVRADGCPQFYLAVEKLVYLLQVLAAEALRGVGGILVDARGQRFVNELGRRDYVTSRIQKVLNSSFGPVRMLLNEDAFAQVAEHGAGRVASRRVSS